MLELLIADESLKAAETLKRLFQTKYNVTSILPDKLEQHIEKKNVPPNIVIFLSKGNISRAAEKVCRIREQWPESIVLALMPTLHGKEQFSGTDIPAHKFLFNPCTKKKVVDSITALSDMVCGDTSDSQDNVILGSIVEFIGERRPNLYTAYSRIMPLIMSLSNKLGHGWKKAQKILTIYIILLSNLDRELVDGMMHGEGRSAAVLEEIYSNMSKMGDLLAMSSDTKDIAQDITYVLKRYDGKGLPKDDVAGQDIPFSSRIIRLLMDYHYLLQSGKTKGQALFILHRRTGWYDDVLVQALIELLGDEGKRCVRKVYPLGLVPGMEIAEDIYGHIDGKRVKILSRNEILTENGIDYLQRHCDDILDITEPINIIEDLFTNGGEASA